MVEKLSARQPSLESRTKVLKEIAATNGIALHVDEPMDPLEVCLFYVEQREHDITCPKSFNQRCFFIKLIQENTAVKIMPDQPISSVDSKLEVDNNMESTSKTKVVDDFSDSFEVQSEFKDVAEAAQAAFVSAAYAAAAARAAVELSRSESHGPDDQNSPSPSARRLEARQKFDHAEKQLQIEHGARGSVRSRNAAEARLSMSSSTSDSGELITTPQVGAGWPNHSQGEIYFDESDNEKEHDQSGSPSDFSSPMRIPSNFQAGLRAESGAGGHVAHPAEATGMHVGQILDLQRRPMSVRTRHVRGY